jgi:hypothetical protein
MIEQEIQERNKQIALMLGWKEEQPGSWFKVTDSVNYVVYSEHNNYPHKGLPFHRDWNWLMEEAVEFIKNQKAENSEHYLFSINDESENVFIINHLAENTYVIQIPIRDSLKEAVFIAVSDFAKLYNDKKL